MSNPERDSTEPNKGEDEAQQGPNLVLLYCLIALALVAAMALAMAIVMPFHHRH